MTPILNASLLVEEYIIYYYIESLIIFNKKIYSYFFFKVKRNNRYLKVKIQLLFRSNITIGTLSYKENSCPKQCNEF